jgi:hypothetical protein
VNEACVRILSPEIETSFGCVSVTQSSGAATGLEYCLHERIGAVHVAFLIFGIACAATSASEGDQGEAREKLRLAIHGFLSE